LSNRIPFKDGLTRIAVRQVLTAQTTFSYVHTAFCSESLIGDKNTCPIRGQVGGAGEYF